MDLYIREWNVGIQGIVDQYKSLIWTKRFREPGEFELYMPMSMEMFNLLKPYRLITRKDDDTIMMIERVRITTDEEDGDHLIVSGRSLEAALDQNIFAWGTYEGAPISGSIFDIAKTVCWERAYRSTLGSNLYFRKDLYSDGNVVITGTHNYSEATKGDNCLEAIKTICQTFGIGYKVTPWDTTYQYFDVVLYPGVDLSQGHYSFPVIFSPEYDNLNSSEYVLDVSTYADSAFVVGGEIMKSSNTKFSGHQQINPSGTDWKRFIFVDASDATTNTDTVTTEANYNAALQAIGKAEIAKHPVIETFEADLDMNQTFVYRKHFWIGSIVTIKNEYGIRMDARIIEVNEVDDENGYSMKPVLERVR